MVGWIAVAVAVVSINGKRGTRPAAWRNAMAGVGTLQAAFVIFFTSELFGPATGHEGHRCSSTVRPATPDFHPVEHPQSFDIRHSSFDIPSPPRFYCAP